MKLTENVEKTIAILLVVFQKIYLVGKLTFGDLYYLHTNLAFIGRNWYTWKSAELEEEGSAVQQMTMLN